GAPKRIRVLSLESWVLGLESWVLSLELLPFSNLSSAFTGFLGFEPLVGTHRHDHLELLHVRFFRRRAREAVNGEAVGLGAERRHRQLSRREHRAQPDDVLVVEGGF